MFLSNFIFAASHLKIHPNCSFKYFETLDIYSQQEKLIKKSTSFRYSYVITNVKKIKRLVLEPLDVLIEQTRIPM